MINLLITSVGTATSVGLIKAFRNTSRCHIVGIDINLFGYTAGSIMVDKFYKVPLAVDNSYMDIIDDIIEKESIDLIIPINDIEVEIFSKCQDDKIRDKCIVPDIDVIKNIKDKYKCSCKMKNAGIIIPEILTDKNIICKKIVRDRIGVGSKGIRIYMPEEKITVNNNQFVQRFIDGTEYTVDVLSDKDGVPIYVIPRERLEVKAGVATKVRITKNNELIDLVKKILGIYKIPGFCNVQFICSEGIYYFIEVNYRFSGCGAATLLAAEGAIDAFLDIAQDRKVFSEVDINWNAIITRYYEEIMYADKK